jgi:hypothetical protein
MRPYISLFFDPFADRKLAGGSDSPREETSADQKCAKSEQAGLRAERATGQQRAGAGFDHEDGDASNPASTYFPVARTTPYVR